MNKSIATLTDIPASTVYRILAALNASGFSHRIETGVYGAGPVSVRLAERYRVHALYNSAVSGSIARLSAASGELAAYMLPLGTEAICIEAVESRNTLRCCFSTGESQPMLRGATAMALLAHLPDDRRRDVFDTYELSPHEIDIIDTLSAQVRSDGYATSVGALDPGVWGASAPVISGDGKLLGTVTVMAPEVRVRERKTEIIRRVVQTASELSGGIS